MLPSPTISKSIDTISDIVDAVPLDSLSDLGDASLAGVVDAVADTADVLVETAAVIGAGGAEVANRTVRVAWSNRRRVAITVAVLSAIIALIVWKQKSSDDESTAPTASS